jgi:predicted DNA-binding transcriptional regulator AlpA
MDFNFKNPTRDFTKHVFNLEEAMTYLGIKSRSTFYKIVRDGRLKSIDLNPNGVYAVRRFTQEALDEFLRRGESRVSGTLKPRDDE